MSDELRAITRPAACLETLPALLREANRLAANGQWDGAASLCDDILRIQPQHADAWLLRGVIELQSGRARSALESLRTARQTRPLHAVTEALLGDTLLELADPEAAVRHYDEALRLNPALQPLQFPRGNALLQLRRAAESLAAYDRFLVLEPKHAEAWFNRGNALLNLSRFQAAIDSFDRAIEARPDYAEALNNRGSALLSLRRFDAALRSFDAATAIDPRFAEAFNNSGIVLRELLRPGEAFERFDRAVRLRDDFAAAIRGCGDALLDQGRVLEALAAYQRAITAGPEIAASHVALGNSLRALGRRADALASYDHALRLDGGNAETHYNRAALLLESDAPAQQVHDGLDSALLLNPQLTQALRLRADTWVALQQPERAIADLESLLTLNADFDYAPGALLHAKQNCADWNRSPAADPRAIESAVLDGRRTDSPFSFLAVSDSAAAQLECARTFASDRCADSHANGAPLQDRPRPYGHQRIRLAYVSGDFRDHAVSYLMAGVFERHDPSRFETFAISLRAPQDSPLGRRVRSAFTHFIDVSDHSDAAVADRMRRAEIDIAVDLTGYTEGCRPKIFAARAAPVQVNYLGFPGTLGARHIDYILADTFLIPADRQFDYEESVVYLPDSFQANDDRLELAADASTRAHHGLPSGSFVFCCFNNTYKINAEWFGAWMRILGQVPHSVLWLLGDSASSRANLQRAATVHGIDAGRLVFAARLPYADHLARLEHADLFLDTLPFNGGTTVSDALRMSLPVLTCPGTAFAARMGGSLLRACGADELIACTRSDYEAKAVALATNPSMLGGIRERLHSGRRSHRLFDTDRMRLSLESAYAHMWATHESGGRPTSFHVDST